MTPLTRARAMSPRPAARLAAVARRCAGQAPTPRAPRRSSSAPPARSRGLAGGVSCAWLPELAVSIAWLAVRKVAFELAEWSAWSVAHSRAVARRAPRYSAPGSRLEGVPLAGGVGQAAVDEQAGAVGFDPAAQSRPVADQRLVGDRDGAARRASRRRASARMPSTRSSRSADCGSRGKLGAIDAPACRLGALTDVGRGSGRSTERSPGRLRQALEGAFGGLRDRAAHPAGLAVAADA